jgi:hypothetical protein
MLDADVLSQSILSTVRKNIKEQYSDAKDMPFQESLAKAVATGIVSTIKKYALVSGGAGNTVAGIGSGIKVPSPDFAATTASSFMARKVGSKGPAMDLIMKGVLIPACAHLSNAVITSISGFGGQGTKISGWTEDQLTKEIMDSFVSDVRKNLQNSKSGMFLIQGISNGFTVVVQSTAVPGAVPVGSTPAGPLIAKVT